MKLKFLFLISITASAVTFAEIDVDSYVDSCNKSQGLSYCQERAKTLNGGQSNMMKGLSDFEKLMEERAEARRHAAPEETAAEKAARLELEAKKLADYRAMMAEEARKEARAHTMRSAIEDDSEEYALEIPQSELNPGANFHRFDYRKITDLKLELDLCFKKQDYAADAPEIMRAIQYIMGWKTNNTVPKRETYNSDYDITVNFPGKPKINGYDDLVIKPLLQISKSKSPQDSLEANFYLGKLYRYGEGQPALDTYSGENAKYKFLHWAHVETNPKKAFEAFSQVVSMLKGEVVAVEGRPSQLRIMLDKSSYMVIQKHQAALMMLAAYEMMQAYHAGDGVKQDDAKARALAHELVQKLGPLHVDDLNWFQMNPLVHPDRATEGAQQYFGTVSYKDVQEFMDPELLAFAQAQLKGS